MKINILASGSAGNCIAITSNDKTILIDAGVAKTKIEKAIAEVGIIPGNVTGVFITHAHGDHIKGLPFADKFNIPVYATAGEWKIIKDATRYAAKQVADGKEITIGEFRVMPFGVHHDSYEPVGYTVETNGGKASVCLDTGKVTQDMLEVMKKSNFYIIESNHEPNILDNSSYPNSVKARIFSDIGHLSNVQTATALSELVQGINEHIYLVHLSDKNNLPAIAQMTVTTALLRKKLRNGKDYFLEVIA